MSVSLEELSAVGMPLSGHGFGTEQVLQNDFMCCGENRQEAEDSTATKAVPVLSEECKLSCGNSMADLVLHAYRGGSPGGEGAGNGVPDGPQQAAALHHPLLFWRLQCGLCCLRLRGKTLSVLKHDLRQ